MIFASDWRCHSTWQVEAGLVRGGREAKAAHQVLMDQLHARWTSDEQRVFLDSHYRVRMERAAHNSGIAHFGTMSGRFVIGGASLAPILTAAGAVANSGFQFWLKIVGICIGALVAVTTATMVAVRASPTWQTYYDLRVALEEIGWQAQADPSYSWAHFVSAVNDAIDSHSKRYAATIIDPSVSQPGI
jgi:hypothetical protein